MQLSLGMLSITYSKNSSTVSRLNKVTKNSINLDGLIEGRLNIALLVWRASNVWSLWTCTMNFVTMLFIRGDWHSSLLWQHWSQPFHSQVSECHYPIASDITQFLSILLTIFNVAMTICKNVNDGPVMVAELENENGPKREMQRF